MACTYIVDDSPLTYQMKTAIRVMPIIVNGYDKRTTKKDSCKW